MRVLIAFIVSPLIASVVYVALAQVPLANFLAWVELVSIGAGAMTILFALPIYILLRIKRKLTFLTVLVASIAVPVIPVLIISIWTGFPSKGSFFAEGHIIRDHGGYTLYGLWFVFVGLLATALSGSVAGVSFWLIAYRKWGKQRVVSDDTNS